MIYYDHFGKENNEKRKEEHKKKCADKMMALILKHWVWDDTEGLWDREDFRLRMTEKIRSVVEFNRWPVAHRIRMLGCLGHFLLPGVLELPDEDDFQTLGSHELHLINGRLDRIPEAPGYLLSPTELRFWKNTKDRERIGEETIVLSAEAAHRLDALLCLK